MSGTLKEPPRWSARRWLYALLAAFAAQVGLLLVLGLRPHPLPPPFRPPTRIVPASDPRLERQIALLPWLRDPTLFVLPAPQSFSGRAWLRFALLERPLRDWSEPPRWLEFAEQPCGTAFTEHARTITNRPLIIADLPLPPLTGSMLPVPNQPVGQKSRVRLEGDLAARAWRAAIPLRGWPHTEVLTNTVVQLAVDAEGRPVATTLLAESGLPAADLYALREAANARFEPLRRPGGTRAPDPRLTWGRLVFQWQTLLPAAGNAPGPTP
ncbi:MAG: hypothetical protein JXQ71_08990 [Verrucomicrobia bacterium]|nr:hypothetical protein [Verrucomicrobiota bacterium]